MQCPKCKTDNPDESVFCAKCGTQIKEVEEDIPVTLTIEAPKEELTTGSTFAGRYQIIEELGKGGMGKVYKAHDTKIKEKIALKLIKPEIAKDRKTIERFSNELKFARKIRHKNICQMFDLGEEKGTHFITMEFVEGQDLKKLIRQSGQLAIGTTMSIAKQVCDGLVEAHSSGVVHRDLKPNNIMIDEEGNARIMDFGIARSLGSKSITGPGVMIGTPEYMSPEQVEGKEVDHRSDIYSFGVILYEMVTGKVPFEGDTPFTVGVKHKSEFPQNPKEINSQIPDDLNDVILRCLEKDKQQRYQKVEDVRSELEAIIRGIPITERIVPEKKPLTSREITVQFSLKRLLIPAFVTLAVIIIGLILWSPWSRVETSTEISAEKLSLAVLPFEDFSQEKDQENLCLGLAAELIHRLNNVQALWVPARASSFSFRGTDTDIQQIGSRLNVNYVLVGTLQKAANKLRISVELINIADNDIIWSETYERDEGDIFDLEDDLALSIIEKLKINLLGEERAVVVKRYTENIEAYNLYLQGRSYWNMRTEEGIYKAIEYMKSAINLDPDYALAYAGLADAYILLADWWFIGSDEGFSKARLAATKALELDSSLAEAHNSMAVIQYMYDWDWISAEEQFKEAISLNPNYASAHQEYAEYLTCLGRFDEALKEIDLAEQLDPLSPIIKAVKSWIYLYSREYDKSIQHSINILETEAKYRPALAYLGRAYSAKEKHEEALKIFQEINFYEVGIVLARMGKKKEAMNQIAHSIEMSKQTKSIREGLIAKIYFALGDKEKGFMWLEKAIEERVCTLRDLKVALEYDSVRSDPRFKAILKRMNLD